MKNGSADNTQTQIYAKYKWQDSLYRNIEEISWQPLYIFNGFK